MRTQINHRYIIAVAFVISLLIHFGSYISLYLSPLEHKKNEQPLEVTLVEPKDASKNTAVDDEKKLKQVVEQNKTINDDIPKDAKFLSQFNQKVKKETRAAQTGQFQNTGGQGQAHQTTPAIAKETPTESTEKQDVTSDKQKIVKHSKKSVMNHDKSAETKARSTVGVVQNNDATAPSAVEAFKPAYDWTKAVRERDQKEASEAQAGGDGNQASQTNDFLPDQERGIQTILNTREFMYYSYYNRIKQQLNQFWEPKLKEKVTDLFRHGRHIASNKDHITKLLIILNDKGTLVGVKVLGPSGEETLDQAAVEAFQQAAPFPNPPKGIVESDGTIKIRWDFILEV